MLSIRCKDCNKELLGHPTKTITCGCPNMATIRGDKISAVDLSRVVMLNSLKETQKSNVLSNQDLAFQEARRQRKVRKLDFEIR
jgi:phage FluMu protein Com